MSHSGMTSHLPRRQQMSVARRGQRRSAKVSEGRRRSAKLDEAQRRVEVERAHAPPFGRIHLCYRRDDNVELLVRDSLRQEARRHHLGGGVVGEPHVRRAHRARGAVARDIAQPRGAVAEAPQAISGQHRRRTPAQGRLRNIIVDKLSRRGGEERASEKGTAATPQPVARRAPAT